MQIKLIFFATLKERAGLSQTDLLVTGPLTVGELVDTSGMKQANVSKHLGVLHDHHLLKREREGIYIRYEIADPMIFSLCNLVCGKVERDAKSVAALFHPEI